MFHFPFFRKPEPAPVRYVVATASDNAKARTARIHTRLQLEVAVARLTEDQRKAAIQSASNGRPIYEGKRRAGE